MRSGDHAEQQRVRERRSPARGVLRVAAPPLAGELDAGRHEIEGAAGQVGGEVEAVRAAAQAAAARELRADARRRELDAVPGTLEGQEVRAGAVEQEAG